MFICCHEPEEDEVEEVGGLMVLPSPLEKETEAQEEEPEAVQEPEEEVKEVEPLPTLQAVPQEEEEPPEVEPVGYSFETELTRGVEEWGWTLDRWVCGYQVMRVGSKGVALYNNGATHERRIHQYDLITHIDEKLATHAQLTTTKDIDAKSKMKVRVLRGAELAVRVTKPGPSWGVNLTYQRPHGICLMVKSLDDPPPILDSVDQEKRPWLALKPYDFIVQVNTATGGYKALVDELSKSKDVDLKVLRGQAQCDWRRWEIRRDAEERQQRDDQAGKET